MLKFSKPDENYTVGLEVNQKEDDGDALVITFSFTISKYDTFLFMQIQKFMRDVLYRLRTLPYLHDILSEDVNMTHFLGKN